MEYRHSVSLDLEKCKGCTHCLRRCPTEAIRIRDGHAVINAIQCIDCGECIRVCPYKAKRAICDSLEDLDRSKYLIALPAPSLFGQFINVTDVDYVLQGLLDMGFNDVFEVSRCAEIITEYTRRYMKRPDIPRPAISSACPVVVRLITIRFPSLIDHIIPLMPPIELAGRMAKEEAMRKHPELKPEDIKTVFISPCPAKFSWVKNGDKEDDVPCVDYVVAISEVYFKLLNAIKPKNTPKIASETGMIGLERSVSGGGWHRKRDPRAGQHRDGQLPQRGVCRTGRLQRRLCGRGPHRGKPLHRSGPFADPASVHARKPQPHTQTGGKRGCAGGYPHGEAGHIRQCFRPEREPVRVHPHDG